VTQAGRPDSVSRIPDPAGAQLCGGASGEVRAAADDPDLRLVAEYWPLLSKAIVRAILALVRIDG